MENYSDLKKQLNNLPKGYISKKTIKGTDRYYLQWREENKIVSKYIKKDELSFIQSQLHERKVIEDKIRELLSSKKELRNLNNNALSLSGYVMEEDDVVATFKNGELINIDENRAPTIIVKTHSLDTWLAKRSIDNHRTNSRMLKKALRLKSNNEIENVLRVNAVSITDSFWFRPLNSKLKYKDVVYDNDLYNETALNGDIENLPEKIYITPELVNTGSYEKCWKLINNEWYMIKKGDKKEIFAELFSSKLANVLGIPSAIYELYDSNVITKNFSKDYNLEPISCFAGDDDSYENVYHAIEKINHEFLNEYLLLTWFDALVDNVDRHNENIAILREKKTGKILSLAPNYDNNMALYSLKENGLSNGFSIINDFEKFIKSNKDVKERFLNLNIPNVNEVTIKDIVESIDINYQMKGINEFILYRYRELATFKSNLQR